MIKKLLLKGLCILGLTLLPISFSNSAWNSVSCQEFTDSSTLIVYSNTILTFPNGNFTTNRLNNSIEHVAWLTYSNYSSTESNYSNISSFFSWYNGKPYLFAGYKSDNYQGTPSNVCVESLDGFNITSFGSNMNCTSEDINSFLSVSNIQGGYICYPDSSNTYAYAPFTYCFYDSNNVYCFKLTSYKNSPDRQVLTLTNSLNLPGWIKPSDFDSFEWESSPLSSSSSMPVVPDYEFNEDDIYTNEQIIQGYNAMGLTDEFCYGGFALDNIFEAGTVPQMFTGYRWGGGAFIFDIWNIYSGAYNNDYISFLRSFYISYENNNYSDFYGKTKALYGFINQWFSVSSKGLGFIEATAPTFTLVDVWQYCDLKFNKNPNAVYTGDRWDPKFRYYTSGQVNLGGYFNFSGNNNYFSGNLSGFNTPKDFFASLNSIFQGGLNNLENREPVLPTYIIVFFLAIIFIRIISH